MILIGKRFLLKAKKLAKINEHQKKTTKRYRDNYDLIFGKKSIKSVQKRAGKRQLKLTGMVAQLVEKKN